MSTPSIAALAGKQFAPERQHYGLRDTHLYALGLGIGHDACDAYHLAHLRAENPQVVPSQAAVLAASSAWMRDPGNGVDGTQLVALSHRIELDRELPPQGSVESRLRVSDVRAAVRGGARSSTGPGSCSARMASAWPSSGAARWPVETAASEETRQSAARSRRLTRKPRWR